MDHCPNYGASFPIRERIIPTGDTLGSGGSKTVIGAYVDGIQRALAIPNQVDTTPIQQEKWQSVLREPEHAKILQNLGLLTVPDYDIIDVVINKQPVKAMSMTPFSELPFTVIDGKGASDALDKSPLSDTEKVSDIFDRISGIKDDISMLAKNGIVLQSDSMHFAHMDDGSLRLFFFDLQDMKIDRERDNLYESYARMIISKLDNLFSLEQHRKFSEQGYDLFARRELVDRLAASCRK